MSLIDEWTPLFPNDEEPAPTPAPVGSASGASGGKLQSRIYRQLSALRPAPSAVHYYLGEGFRWIRVGFDGEVPLAPAAMLSVGQVIAASLGKTEKSPLYVHALRPHDMLFFLEGGDADSEGLPPHFYGAPLEKVQQAWVPASRRAPQARTAASASSRAAAPYSQRRRSKA